MDYVKITVSSILEIEMYKSAVIPEHPSKEVPGHIYIITFLLQCSGYDVYSSQHSRVNIKALGLYSF